MGAIGDNLFGGSDAKNAKTYGNTATGYMDQALGKTGQLYQTGQGMTSSGMDAINSYLKKTQDDANLGQRDTWQKAMTAVNANNANYRPIEQNIQRNMMQGGQKQNQLFQLAMQRAAGNTAAFQNTQNQLQNNQAQAAQLGLSLADLGRAYMGDNISALSDASSAFMTQAGNAQNAANAKKSAGIGTISNIAGSVIGAI